MSLHSYWSEHASAPEGELGDTVRAYAPPDDNEAPARRRNNAVEFGIMIFVALLIAGAVALFWPASSTSELAADAGALARGTEKDPCVGPDLAVSERRLPAQVAVIAQ